MTALTIASNSLRRFTRDRTALFFIVVLPILVIVIVGATVTGFGAFRIGLVVEGSGPRTDALIAALQKSDAMIVTRFATIDRAASAVRRSEQSASIVIPDHYDADIAAGRPSTIELVGDRTSTAFIAAGSAVQSVVASQASLVQAARFATEHVGGTFDENLARAESVSRSTAHVVVTATSVDTRGRTLPQGFSYSAPTMLVLFVFINSLASGASIIESRKLGMYERMAAAPVRRRDIVIGETLTYLSIALFQSLLIVGLGAVVFGVSWGSPPAAAALILMWALVGTGAGVLSGTLMRTPEQASSIGPPLGIAAGMLGGCMWPLEIVPPVMRTIGHFLPHAWAVDAWTILLSRNGGIGDIAGQLAVLAGFAAVLLTIATLRLRTHLVA